MTGSEQLDYFKVVLNAMALVLPDIAKKMTHITHGFLMLPTGKMSSRTGDVVPAETLLAQIEAKIATKTADRSWPKKEKNTIIEQIAIGALKFSILKQSPGKDIIFDFDKSLSLEGDSGPYLQYTAVRAGSILTKAKEMNLSLSEIKPTADILDLERSLYLLPEIIERAGRENSPQLVVTYLLELASVFNGFYASTKVLDNDNALTPYHLALTKATRRVLKNGLSVLGIKVPVKM